MTPTHEKWGVSWLGAGKDGYFTVMMASACLAAREGEEEEVMI
jgi:hypothetical protein